MKLYSYEHFAIQRRRKGKSQDDLAHEAGVTQGFIAQIENGLRSIPEDIQKIYPKKLTSVKRHEMFWLLLRRAGLRHEEAKKLFSVTAREFNDWMRGDTRIPDWAFDYAVKCEPRNRKKV